jgi:hypothetical protein
MMSETVNLSRKDLAQIQQRFAIESLLQSRLNNDFDFVGARTVRVFTVASSPLQDYDRAAPGNRYGVPSEVGDSVQELTMKRDRSFAKTIDKGNDRDQSIKKAGQFVKIQMDEQVIPEKDGYGFGVLGRSGGMIVGATAAISKDTVIGRLSAGRASLLNNRVPLPGRTLYVCTDMYNALVETPQFINLEKLGGKAIAKGQIGEIFGSPVVEVPADLFPAGVNFIWLHKAAATSPSKIDETKVHLDPPGISGHLVEGRFYWDTFVIGAKAAGVYVDVTTGGGVSVLSAPTVNAATGAIAGVTSGASAYFTTDGTDPRYSATAQAGTAPSVVAGDVVKAYQANAANASVYPSPVVTVTITG